LSTQDERSAAPLDRIRLTGVQTTGYHGVFEHERREGQTFVADVVVYLDTRRAAARDDLAHTLDYGALAQQVVAVLEGDPADLIETVAERIAATVLSHAIVQGVDVTLHKPQAPIPVPFADVTVEIHRDRNKLPAAEPVLGDGATAVRPPRPEPVRTAALPVVGAAGAAGAAAGAVVDAAVAAPQSGDAVTGAVALAPASAPVPAPPPVATSMDAYAASAGPVPPAPVPPEPGPVLPGPVAPASGPVPPAPGAVLPGGPAEGLIETPVWAPIPGVSGAGAAPEPVEPVAIGPAPVEALPTGVVPAVTLAGSPTGSTAAVALPVPTALVAPASVPAGPAAPPEAEGELPPAPAVEPVAAAAATPSLPAPPAGPATPVGELVPVDVVDAELVTDALDEAPPAPVDVVIALGANLGPAQETLRRAVHDLAATPGLQIVQVSPLARTAPVGGPEQPDFLNAVVLARSTLAPRALLHATQRIEQRHGRERHEHWGPRTLDVDIVVYGGVLAVTDDLELPHPRAHERAFVLQPWAEVDPHAVLPGLGGGPVAALAATAPDREGLRWMALDWLEAPSTAPAAPAPHAAPTPAPAPTPSPAPRAPQAPAVPPASASAQPPTVPPTPPAIPVPPAPAGAPVPAPAPQAAPAPAGEQPPALES